MMTTKEASQLSIKMAGYGIKDTVVIAIQEDARKTSLETYKNQVLKILNEYTFYSGLDYNQLKEKIEKI